MRTEDITKLCEAVPPDLAELIRKYPEIFPDDLPAGLPPSRPEDHRIELEPGAQPTVQQQFRLSQPELEELQQQLDYLLSKGFIRPSTSPYAAPILFTPKKDGGFRMCIDYRALNRITIKSRYPIPRADDLLDQLRGAKFFSKIDLRGGYHQIRVAADNCHKTAFRTRYGSYEYLVMPFGLTNAPSTFQMTMNGVFRELLDKCVIIYLDDILIYSRNREQHLKDLDAVFTLLHKNRLITKGSKCDFLKQELEFLGHVVSTEGVKSTPRKSRLYRNGSRRPTSRTAEFSGFRQLRPPLHPQYGWKQQNAFDQLKIALTSPPVLHISDLDRPYEVVTDASDIAIGAVLLQDFGDGLQPVAYESRKLHGAEKNYTVHDKEMLAIVHAFKTWRCYLTGADVTVRTDHKSLQYLRAQPNLNPRQIRSLDFLESNFHYTITYKRGATNIADALTRLLWPTTCASTCPPTLPAILKIVAARAAGLLQPLDPPERPWQQVTMDYVTGLPAGPSGNDAILVVVDRLTKMAHFITCQQTITPNKPRNCSSRTSSDCTDYPPPSFQIETRNSHRIFGATYGTNSAPNSNFHPPTTHRRRADRTRQPDHGATDSYYLY
ncbi:hypothetical protein CLOP_g11703 [Closterium sp. NIES-67]|nr:hypothetical protein CLOP_g11703 [Closterium sp. NIES-67]